MAEDYHVPGPACQLCERFEAIGSVQNLADWSTTRFCGECGPGYLRAMADAIDGGTPAAPETAGGEGEGEQLAALDSPGAETCPMCGATVEVADIQGHVEMHAAEQAGETDNAEPGSARDHWASTTHVRRSTHGHRTTKRPDSGPKEGDAP